MSTMSNINYSCDFCCSPIEYVYEPINSKRGMKVFACNKCGLLTSKSFKEYASRPPGNMSSDADRSSYRYTKTLVADSYSNLLIKYIQGIPIKEMLDVGINRGAFYKWACKNLRFNKVTGIETDKSITSEYKDDLKVDLIIDRIENIQLKEKKYDFAFCAHTLEHALSAKGMLQQIFDSLTIGGYFFLAVPNLVWHEDVVEEFFIDPHTFHFNYYVLKGFVQAAGYDIVYSGDPSAPDIIFILKKNKKIFLLNDYNPVSENILNIKDKILDYKKLINSNRRLIKETAEEITSHCDKGGKCFIWGAGRIFDALVKFGKLKPNKNLYLIDKYLSDIFDQSNGIDVNKPEQVISEISETSIVYVASRNYKNEILKEAKGFGFSKALVFGSGLKLIDI